MKYQTLEKKNELAHRLEETELKLSQIPFQEKKLIQSFPFSLFYSEKLGRSLTVDPFIGSGFFVKNGHITRLQIRNNPDLCQISEDLRFLTHLEALILDTTRLSHLPSTISSLSSLKYLKLQYNTLTQLPANFGDLINLRYLSIVEEGLKSLPESFKNLKNLKILGIRMVSDSFLQQISNLKNLEELSFSADNIQELPSDFGNLPFLRILLLSDNFLSSLPPTMASLKSLNILNLQNNQFSILPSWLACLPNLKTLSLFQNPIISLTGIPKHLYHHFDTFLNWEALPPTAQHLFHSHDEDGLFAFYSPSAMDLAQKLVGNPNSLSEDDQYRLITEASENERAYLDLHLPANSPILYKIDQHFLKRSVGKNLILF